MNLTPIIIGNIVSYISRTFGLGAGATWPGELALRIDSHILSTLVQKVTRGVIIVAGTNGKTTTSAMIERVLVDQGYTVLHNKSGANLLNGVVSSFFADWKTSYDYAVFEVDENALPSIMTNVQLGITNKQITIVLLNLFRDQLDRYGEVDTIATQWQEALQSFPKETTVIINADDPHLSHIGSHIAATPVYVGLGDKKYYLPKMQHATDTIYCPSCGERLSFAGVYFSHLGDWSCPQCAFTHPQNALSSNDVTSPLEGIYNIYNTLLATETLLQLDIPKDTIQKSLNTFSPAFGRMETIAYKGKQIRILLSKNPTGCNESLRTMIQSEQKGPVLLLLNDRTPDGTDVSWIWDVDFEQLDGYKYPIIISGDRYLDMAVRLKYANTNYQLQIMHKNMYVTEKLEDAVDNFVKKINNGEIGWIIATYSAMLDVRKIMTGKKIL